MAYNARKHCAHLPASSGRGPNWEGGASLQHIHALVAKGIDSRSGRRVCRGNRAAVWATTMLPGSIEGASSSGLQDMGHPTLRERPAAYDPLPFVNAGQE